MKKIITILLVILILKAGIAQVGYSDVRTFPPASQIVDVFPLAKWYQDDGDYDGVNDGVIRPSYSNQNYGQIYDEVTWPFPSTQLGHATLLKVIVPPGVGKVQTYGQTASQNQVDAYITSGYINKPYDYIGDFLDNGCYGSCDENKLTYSVVTRDGVDVNWDHISLNFNIEIVPDLYQTSVPKYSYIAWYKPSGASSNPYSNIRLVTYNLIYEVVDSLIYNNWVNNGHPSVEDCEDMNAGEIPNQLTINELYNNETINSITPATGGVGSISYLWQYNAYDATCTGDTCWVNDSTNMGENYNIPDNLPIGTYFARRLAYNDCGYLGSNIVELTVSQSTEIENNNFNNDFTIYPNPAKNFIVIENNNLKIKEIKITDITGKVCKSNILVRENTIDVSDLNNGVYFIKVGTQVQKFIKE